MQSGFRTGHGCTSATLKILNDILTAIDKRHYCAAVFIDLAKAFDSVNHHIIIDRLNILGFSNYCLAWFTNYFSDRVQCVKSEGLLSGPLAVSMGVPQGSILCIHQWCRSCCWWFSDPPLRRRHHCVNIRPFIGHCVNKPPNELQCHTTLLPWPPNALKR